MSTRSDLANRALEPDLLQLLHADGVEVFVLQKLQVRQLARAHAKVGDHFVIVLLKFNLRQECEHWICFRVNRGAFAVARIAHVCQQRGRH